MAANDIIDQVEMEMMGAVEAAEKDYASYRTGKASPQLVENILVEYYGTHTRLREIAGITAPEPRLLVIQPWDQSAVGAIEKAIQTSEIGISPVSDGRIIRLPIPELSEERRRNLVKQLHKRSEDAKVAIRAHRRDGNELVKSALKDGDVSEDEMHQLKDKIQELTDSYIAKVDELTAKKEQELMQL